MELANAGLGDIGVMLVAKQLQNIYHEDPKQFSNKDLEKIDLVLSGNGIGNAGAKSLTKALGWSQESRNGKNIRFRRTF